MNYDDEATNDTEYIYMPPDNDEEDEEDDIYQEEDDDEDEEDEDEDDEDDEMDVEALENMLEEAGVELEPDVADDNDDDAGNNTAAIERQGETFYVTPQNIQNQILLLAARGHFRDAIGQLFRGRRTFLDDDDEDDEVGRPRRRTRPTYFQPTEVVPNPKGQELMRSGDFGSVDPQPLSRGKDMRMKSRSLNIIDRLVSFESGMRQVPKHAAAKRYRPNSKGEVVERYDSRAYSGQFSLDGSFFYACLQDFSVHLYDSTDLDNLKEYKTVRGETYRWTITDANLSPDNQWLIYSSITPIVYLAKTTPDEDVQYTLDFSDGGYGGYDFGIWSIRFSGDGREIVAGAADQRMYVYDIETRRSVLELDGHNDDVNAVCFADQSSNVLFSGSDDSLIKVWDRRSLRNGKESGIFLGHTEGITFVSAKGDGRYCLSNGKDQSMKLWDIRMMMSSSDFSRLSRVDYSVPGFDYRHMPYPGSRVQKHPNDCSVMTYRGHRVLKTLIRCGFSPAESTGQRYVYSGSEDGKAHIWDLDGQVVQVLDTATACMEDNDDTGRRRARRYNPLLGAHHSRVCVRDVSWHPRKPTLVTTAWTDYHASSGTIVRHDYREIVNEYENEKQNVDLVNDQSPGEKSPAIECMDQDHTGSVRADRARRRQLLREVSRGLGSGS